MKNYFRLWYKWMYSYNIKWIFLVCVYRLSAAHKNPKRWRWNGLRWAWLSSFFSLWSWPAASYGSIGCQSWKSVRFIKPAQGTTLKHPHIHMIRHTAWPFSWGLLFSLPWLVCCNSSFTGAAEGLHKPANSNSRISSRLYLLLRNGRRMELRWEWQQSLHLLHMLCM